MENVWELCNTYRLVGLGAALVAGVRGDLQHWLDLGAACHNASHLHQLADVGGLHCADRLWLQRRWSLEIHLTVGRIQKMLWDFVILIQDNS